MNYKPKRIKVDPRCPGGQQAVEVHAEGPTGPTVTGRPGSGKEPKRNLFESYSRGDYYGK